MNDSSNSEAYVNTEKGFFITDGAGNKFKEASEFLLNGLDPRG
jgi:hypothetical protein